MRLAFKPLSELKALARRLPIYYFSAQKMQNSSTGGIKRERETSTFLLFFFGISLKNAREKSSAKLTVNGECALFRIFICLFIFFLQLISAPYREKKSTKFD